MLWRRHNGTGGSTSPIPAGGKMVPTIDRFTAAPVYTLKNREICASYTDVCAEIKERTDRRTRAFKFKKIRKTVFIRHTNFERTDQSGSKTVSYNVKILIILMAV
jgi:hypothetical protein